MKLLKHFLLITCFITIGCNEVNTKNQQGALTENNAVEKISKTEINFGRSERVPTTPFYIYPISNSIEKTKLLEYSHIRKGSYKGYFNLIFHNIETNKNHFLLPKNENAIITTFPTNLENDNPSKNRKEDFLFFEIIKDDYNNDGNLNYDDPKKLYISNLEGNNLRCISPANLNLLNWKFIDDSKTLIELRCSLDENNDHKFEQDEAKKVIIAKIDSTKVTYIEPFAKELIYNLKKERVQHVK